MQRRLDTETGVNKPFENVFMSGVYSEFFSGKGTSFRDFSSLVFQTDSILSNWSNKYDFKRVQGHAPSKNVWKFAYCNGHFSAF